MIACPEPGTGRSPYFHGLASGFANLRAWSRRTPPGRALPPFCRAVSLGGRVAFASERSGPESPTLEAAAASGVPGGTCGPAKSVTNSEGVRVRWMQAPELVVLMSVMRYHAGPGVEYSATDTVLTEAEADEMVTNLTEALAVLSDKNFSAFAAVHREAVQPGATARIVRSGRIVVGRFEGLRELRQTIGLGGRVPGKDSAISSAAVLLDSEYDRTSTQRRLLRMQSSVTRSVTTTSIRVRRS